MRKHRMHLPMGDDGWMPNVRQQGEGIPEYHAAPCMTRWWTTAGQVDAAPAYHATVAADVLK